MSIRSELRDAAMERAGGRCEWPGCGTATDWTWLGGLEMSHIIPMGSGGKDTIENVWMLCKYHHDMHDGRVPRKLREYRLLALAYVAVKYGYE